MDDRIDLILQRLSHFLRIYRINQESLYPQGYILFVDEVVAFLWDIVDVDCLGRVKMTITTQLL